MAPAQVQGTQSGLQWLKYSLSLLCSGSDVFHNIVWKHMAATPSHAFHERVDSSGATALMVKHAYFQAYFSSVFASELTQNH